MPRYVALLRGINVGGNKKVGMARLRELLTGLGHSEVATLLQSGNAVFTNKRAVTANKIEAALAAEFGFEVQVVLRTRDALAAAIAANPLAGADADPSHFTVTFLSGAPNVSGLVAATFAPDEFRVVGHEIYARFPNGIGNSKLAVALVGPRLGVTGTSRNWSTVRKLLLLADSVS